MKLPLKEYPVVSHYNTAALVFGALEALSSSIDQLYFNYCTQCIFYPKQGPDAIICENPYIDYDFLGSSLGVINLQRLTNYQEAGPSGILDFVFEGLARKGYLLLYLDDYFVLGRPGYGAKHLLHDVGVYGYDAAEEKFHSVYYRDNGGLNYCSIDRYSLEASLGYLCGDSPNRLAWSPKNLSPLSFYVNPSARIEYNVEKFCSELGAYLDGDLVYPAMVSNQDLQGARSYFDQNESYVGLGIYEGLVRYIERNGSRAIFSFFGILSNRSNLTLVPFKQLHQHKKCMMMRLKKLNREFGASSDFWRRYQGVEREAQKLSLRCYDCFMKGSFGGAVVRDLRVLRELELGVLKDVHSWMLSAGIREEWGVRLGLDSRSRVES